MEYADDYEERHANITLSSINNTIPAAHDLDQALTKSHHRLKADTRRRAASFAHIPEPRTPSHARPHVKPGLFSQKAEFRSV